jgi:hypothetical protein
MKDTLDVLLPDVKWCGSVMISIVAMESRRSGGYVVNVV